MKYLDQPPALAGLSDLLTNLKQVGGVVINGKLVALSCKRIREDRIDAKVLHAKLRRSGLAKTSLGNMLVQANRQLFIDLVQSVVTSPVLGDIL